MEAKAKHAKKPKRPTTRKPTRKPTTRKPKKLDTEIKLNVVESPTNEDYEDIFDGLVDLSILG